MSGEPAAQKSTWSLPTIERKNPPKKYLNLHLRIRYLWLAMFAAFAITVYPILVIYSAYSMQYWETHGPDSIYQKQWEATGCPEKLRAMAKAFPLDDWGSRHRLKQLLLLDDSYPARNSQAILDEPFCLGSTVALLVRKPGPWRYDIVDSKSQKIIVSVIKGE